MNVTDYNLALTTAGLALMAKIQAGDGKVPLDITRVVISSDESGDPLNMAVDDVVITLNMDIMSREIIGGVRTVIRVKATNIGNPRADPIVPPVLKGFLLSRILIFANDPDEGEIVYRVSQFSSPNYVPPATLMPWTFEPTFNFVTGNASDVTIQIDPKGLSSRQDIWNSVELSGEEAANYGVRTHHRIVGDASEYEPAEPTSERFAGAKITETRIIADPSNPQTSEYQAALPVTVPEAVIMPDGSTLSEVLRNLLETIAPLKSFRVENGILTNYVNYGYIEDGETLAFFDEFARVEDETLVLI